MTRVITDPQNHTAASLENYEWDVIRTNVTVDIPNLLNWCNSTIDKFPEAAFNWSKTDLMNERARQMTEQKKSVMWGYPDQWTLQWSTPRTDALPNPFLCDPEIYPEVKDPEFYTKFSTDLDQYNHGFYKKIKDTLDPDCYKITRLVRFGNQQGLHPHYDIEKGGYLIRMHVQAQVDDQCIWKFGGHQDRSYANMEAGRIYLYNTAILHSAINLGNTPWIFIHNDPEYSAIDRILKMNLHIE